MPRLYPHTWMKRRGTIWLPNDIGDALLLETGDYLLLETGDYLLLE